MSDIKLASSSQGICGFIDEDALITGGKSVSEIIQMLRTNAKVKKIVNGCDDNEDREEQSRKISFPWMLQFGVSCKDVISNPSIVKLDRLMSSFIKEVEKDVKECAKKPKRAYRLRLRMNPFIILFHMIYWEIKKPLEHTSYLDRMSDIMALFIDVELKSSRIARENPKKISQRICTSLYMLLDKSTDHILDSVLKSTFFNKNYSEICVPVMERLLKDNPGKLYEATYVRYLLSFKLWKRLVEKQQHAKINKEALAKLKPPPNFAERLKGGMFPNVLPFPYLSKKENLTNFFMRSPFNVKEKAQLFLKDGRKLQPLADFDKAFLFDEEFKTVNLFDKDIEMDDKNELINNVWSSLVEKESDPLDELLDCESMDEEDSILFDIKKNKSKEKIKKAPKDNVTSSPVKISPKKRRMSKPNLIVSVKSVSTKDPVEIVKPEKKLIKIPGETKEDKSCISIVDENFKKNDTPSPLTNQEIIQKKPCAAVEPEQCKEVEPDSQTKSESEQLSNHNIRASPIIALEMNKGITPNKESAESSSVKSLQPCEFIDISSPVNETVIEDLPELVDSTGICEEVKIETNTSTPFNVNQIFKDTLHFSPVEEVAQEVTIATEISQEDATNLFIDTEDQIILKDNHNDEINGYGVRKESRQLYSDSLESGSETWKNDKEPKEICQQTNNFNVTCTQSKLNFIKDHSTESQNTQQLLSHYDNTGECLLDQRQDSFSFNEIKLTRLLSPELNVDEESDDDHRHPNRQFASGGKFPAFRAQTNDESKSDVGEESEVPSPASQSDSNPVEVSTESTTSPSVASSQEKKPGLKGDILPLSSPTNQGKSIAISPLQLQEVSVSLLYISDLDKRNDYNINTVKSNAKGTSDHPPLDVILHFKTLRDYLEFNKFQQQLYTLYITTDSILETDPVPYPSTVSINVRCCCSFCEQSLEILRTNYNLLFSMRSSRICQEIDKKRTLSKIYLTIEQIEQSKLEDEKLLKSIEETMPVTNIEPALKKDVNQERLSEKLSDNVREQTITQSKGNTPDNNISNPRDENLEDKSDYSNLPPKKRRAFSIRAQMMRQQVSDCEAVGNEKRRKVNIQTNDDACCQTNQCNQMKKSNCEFGKQPDSSGVIIKDTDKNKQAITSPLDENVGPEQCDNLQSQVSNDISLKASKSRHEKCRKHHKRSKEERRLRKERKRLKKQMKEVRNE